MPMTNPPHPGRIVRQECLQPLGLSVTDAARALGVSRNALSELVNERRGVSPEMAIRLAKALAAHRKSGPACSSPSTWRKPWAAQPDRRAAPAQRPEPPDDGAFRALGAHAIDNAALDNLPCKT